MKLAVVLVADNSGVQVTYLTTFGGESTLPSTLNEKGMWYPISPAENEDIYVPLPALKTNKAQWASLRQKQTITASSVGHFFLPGIVNISDTLWIWCR